MKKAVGKITNVGYNVNNNTVLYLLGESAEIADAPFRVTVNEGPYAVYTHDMRDTLIGAYAEVEYTGVNDTRVPQDVVFIGII